MSSLTDVDKRYLESLLRMQTGWVLDYSDEKFGQFCKRHRVDIHGPKYQTYGTSKAKKLRAFWEQEPDAAVAPVLSELLDAYEADCELNRRDVDTKVLSRARSIVARLSGKPPRENGPTIETFLERDFNLPNVQRLPVESQVARIIEARLAEAGKAFAAGAHLSVIFLCGSVLEGVLLGAAQKDPEKFNRSPTSPKGPSGKVTPFHEWNLAQLIDTACDVGMLGADVKKFSHGLRDFRNFIHPYEQLVSQFTPDQHTARVCFQVLKAALANLSGER